MGSDHNLVITKAKLKVNLSGKKQEGNTRFLGEQVERACD